MSLIPIKKYDNLTENDKERFINIVGKINSIMLKINENVKIELSKENMFIRKSKLTFEDAMIHSFLYSFKDTTKQSITSNYNFNNGIDVTRSSYYKKSEKIPLNVYNIMLNELKICYNNEFVFENDVNMNIYAVDGCNNNTNNNCDFMELNRTLNMGVFDIVNGIPIYLEHIEDGVNTEISQLKILIQKYNIKNTIFVLDRGYVSYDLMNFFESNNLKYIIRGRNNNKLKINETSGLYEHKDLEHDTRLIKFNVPIDFIFFDKFDNELNVRHINEYNIITNLNKELFNDEKIKSLYESRWDIEVYFKFVKNNFKFQNLIEHAGKTIKNNIGNKRYKSKKDKKLTDKIKKVFSPYTRKQYERINLIILIISYIELIFEKTYLYFLCSKNEKDINIIKNISINKSNFIKGIQEIISKIIKQQLTAEMLFNLCKCYVVICLKVKNRHFERVSKTPFTKWYIKDYSSRSFYNRIIEAVNNNSIDKLEDNIKSKSKQIILTLLKKSNNSTLLINENTPIIIKGKNDKNNIEHLNPKLKTKSLNINLEYEHLNLKLETKSLNINLENEHLNLKLETKPLNINLENEHLKTPMLVPIDLNIEHDKEKIKLESSKFCKLMHEFNNEMENQFKLQQLEFCKISNDYCEELKKQCEFYKIINYMLKSLIIL